MTFCDAAERLQVTEVKEDLFKKRTIFLSMFFFFFLCVA